MNRNNDANAGRTFSPPIRPGDFFGTPPKDTIGLSREIGFKYEPAGARISGSISYYIANSRNETFNSYSSYANVVNPSGLNGTFNPALRNVWVNLDKESRGLESILMQHRRSDHQSNPSLRKLKTESGVTMK
jgi:hypothetical protein